MIVQQQQGSGTPTPKKRKGKFRRRLLKKEGSNGKSDIISAPSGAGSFFGFSMGKSWTDWISFG